MTLKIRYPLTILLIFLLVSCSTVTEAPVQILPLVGPLADRESEVSGLAWDSDRLVLMPENPERFPQGDYGSLFYLNRIEIEQAVSGDSDSVLLPKAIPFDDSGLSHRIPGYEGFEAIAFKGDEVFMTIEAKSGDGMMGYLIKGAVDPGTGIIHLDPACLREVEPQSEVGNMTYESLVLADNRLLTFHEINGVDLNLKPKAVVADLALDEVSSIPMEHMEYRLTDATETDSEGRFWVINYFWPGDSAMLPGEDPLAKRFGKGQSHSKSEAVERLVEFQVVNGKVRLTNQPLIQLELAENESRNWEGIVRFGEGGFLVVTDKYPETILGFVQNPEGDQ